ncbi:glycosyltransferase [Candidatus Marsarchaeota archaeon]|nr:glycosyltransferase [Candidatus Marsarchaeota archaeon]
MKVIIAQPYLNIQGGAERVVLEIAKHYDAKIYTLEYDKKNTFEGFSDLDITIIGKDIPLSGILPYKASQGLRFGYNFYNLELKEDYDVINAHISPSEWIRHKNRGVLWYCHTPPREVYDLYAERMKYRTYKEKFIYATMAKAYKMVSHKIVGKIECIATNSETTKERIARYFEREADVANPGIDYNAFENKAYEKFFFYPSRITPNKRQDYVINAFKKFVSKTGRKDYRLVLAGALSKNPEHTAYLTKIKKLSNGLNVKIITNISDKELKDLYSRAYAVLFAAINEDYGYIPLEAMASCKPVISVNEGGPKETILDGKTGFLVNSDKEMGDKMAMLVDYPSTAERMGKEGHKRVSSLYSWKAFFKKFDSLLEDTKKKADL